MGLTNNEAHALLQMVDRKTKRRQERRRIERAYQRAMNIRDSTPGFDEDAEETYTKAYMKAYRSGDATGFTSATRKYLRAVTAARIRALRGGTETMKVRKKPLEVEARGPLTQAEMVTTAHGRVRAEAGDYILTDPKTGDTWPIKPDIFAETYEELST